MEHDTERYNKDCTKRNTKHYTESTTEHSTKHYMGCNTKNYTEAASKNSNLYLALLLRSKSINALISIL
jgi:hypothetical protein